MNRPFLSLVLFVLMVQLASSAAAQVPADFDRAWAEVRARHRAALAEHGIVGSSVVIVHDGTVAAADYAGFADEAAGRRVDEHTIYHWASITKTFTGVAIMQLRDRGLLALDDPITRYLPELRAVHNPFGSMDAITLRHLMSHSAGFRSPTWPWGGGEPWHPHEPTEWAQLVAMFPYTAIQFEPGSTYGYSNPGVIFLGRVVEILTGDDYEVYVDKNILKPLGMYASYFDRTPYHLLEHRSNNYYVENGVRRANGLDFDTGITVSNGGLNAPLTDMAKYLDFLLGGRGEQVLRRSSLEEMWQARLPVGRRGAYEESVGLSFFQMEGKGLRVVGHTGSQKGFISFFYVDPSTGTGAIAVYNTVGVYTDDGPSAPDTRALSYVLREDLFDHVFPLFANRR